MNEHREPMVRLTERNGVGPGISATDARAAARAAVLLRVLQAAPLRLSTAARARIAARLHEQAAAPAMTPRRMYWPAAGAATLVLFAGGAVGATWGLAPAQKLFGRWMRSDAPQARAVSVSRPVASAPATTVEELPEPSEKLAAPKTLATTIIEPESHPLGQPLAAKPRRREPAPAVSLGVTVTELPAEPAVDPVVAESRLLADALSQLRQRREPARALRTLDDYERRFPKGTLMPEASAARIDALLALGRRGEALERLDALAKIDSLPRAAELRVLRGELRAGRGALPGAVSDFGAVLGMAGAPDAVLERALYGRGSSRARLGDAAGARADLQDYLRRFPQGRFAGPAGRALRD
jgi:hypothetical protein